MPSVKAALCVALGVQAADALRKSSGAGAGAKDCYSPYDGMALMHLQPCTSAQAGEVLSQVESLGCFVLDDDFEYEKKCSGTEVVCSKEAASTLEQGRVASVVSPDAGAHYRNSSGVSMAFGGGLNAASTFYTTWRNLEALEAQVAALVQASGGLATLETVGQSLQGRDIKIVRFRGAGYTSGDTRLFATYNIHAREWISGMSAVYQVEHLIKKLQQEPDYLAKTEVVLMPMSNPDGFQYSTTNERMQRKNMRPGSCTGVDLNRNFDSSWGGSGSSGSVCSQTYRGASVESEPETNVIKQVMQEAPMTVYVDVHSYSQLILTSYGYTTATHPRATEYRAIGGAIQSAIREAGGNTWTEGPTAQVLYSASGTTNDYADKLGALGFCFELRPGGSGGGGFAPPASDILPGAQESYAGIIAAIDFAKSYEPPAPTPAPAPGSWVVQGSGCVMDGACVSSKNHPSNYGNNEQCNIELYGDIPISVEAFSTERSYDILTMGGASYSGTSGPPSGSYSGSISWGSDGSVVNSGWRLCRTDA